MWGYFNKGEEVKLPDTYYFMQVFTHLESYFDYDLEKCLIWLDTPNPNLGGSSPSTLFKAGKGNKVLSFVVERVSND